MVDQTIEFVQSIERCPCLYNKTLIEYSRKDIVENAWADIGEKMNWTVAECKEKWRNIRNGFVKSLKTQLYGSSSKTKKRYYLQDVMKFVIPYIKPAKQSKKINVHKRTLRQLSETDEPPSNMETVTLPSETELPIKIESVTSQRQTTVKRKPSTDGPDQTLMNGMAKKAKPTEKVTENARKMFLLSLLPDVEHLSDHNMRLLKIEMMTLLQKYNEKQRTEEDTGNCS